MVLENLQHILWLAGIVPPRQTGSRARGLLLLQQRIIDAAEEGGTQQPLLALGRGGRQRGLPIHVPAALRVSRQVDREPRNLVRDRIIAAVYRSK